MKAGGRKPEAGQTSHLVLQINQLRGHSRTKVFGWQGLETVSADIYAAICGGYSSDEAPPVSAG